ncbi:MAG TPA: hypothetical protein VKS78_17505 [Roseiarcus sp.]|nr:hypothetical protein [Roseiarcus sp.]
MPNSITVQPQNPGDSATMFRLWIDGKVVGESLTAAQTHLLVGEILERIALPRIGRVIRGARRLADEDLNDRQSLL